MPVKYIGANYPQDNASVPKADGKVSSASTSAGVVRNVYTSTGTPSGGSDGDVWIQYTA